MNGNDDDFPVCDVNGYQMVHLPVGLRYYVLITISGGGLEHDFYFSI